MRKEAVFTLLLNVPLFKGMRCTLAQDPRYMRFSCFENGSITHYNLRVSSSLSNLYRPRLKDHTVGECEGSWRAT